MLVPALVAGMATAALMGNTTRPAPGLLWGLCAALIVLGLQRPAWALGAVLAAELTFGDQYIRGLPVSIRLGLILVTALISAGTLLRGLRSPSQGFGLVVIPATAFLALVTVGNVTHSDLDYVTRYLRYEVVLFLTLVITACVIRSRQDLKYLAIVGLGVGVASGVVAIWQHFAPATYLYLSGTSVLRGRAIGLSPGPVNLPNDLGFALCFILGVLFVGGLRINPRQTLLGAAALAVMVGMYFSYTRSAMLALGPALCAMALFLRGPLRPLLLGSIVAAVLIYPELQGTGLLGERYYRGAEEDSSAASHMALWQVGWAVALDKGMTGIGHQQFEEISQDYVHQLSDDGGAALGARDIGSQRPHNDFLSVWISWGILALVAFLAIYVATIINCIIAARSEDWLVRGLAIGCLGGIIRYAADSAFHNYFDSGTYLWMYAGLSVALVRVATNASGNPIAMGWPSAPRAPRRLGRGPMVRKRPHR
jgi:O-antigen ligase